MKRQAFDESKEAIPHAHGSPRQPVANCRKCLSEAPFKFASEHGRMCEACFGRYASAPAETAPDVGDKRIDPRAWAYRLRDREARGDRLTQAQRTMWRAAIPEHEHAQG